MTIISNVSEDGKPIGEHGDGEVNWHTDLAVTEEPSALTMLLAGGATRRGNTSFATMQAAVEVLRPETRAMLPPQLVFAPTLDHRGAARRNAPAFLPNMLNSLIVTVGATLLTVRCSTLAGCVYTRIRGRIRARSVLPLVVSEMLSTTDAT